MDLERNNVKEFEIEIDMICEGNKKNWKWSKMNDLVWTSEVQLVSKIGDNKKLKLSSVEPVPRVGYYPLKTNNIKNYLPIKIENSLIFTLNFK